MSPIDPTSWMPITYLAIAYKRVEALCEAIEAKHSVSDRERNDMLCRHGIIPLSYDDCLAACPWNKFAREGKLMKEHARVDLAVPDLLELLALDDASFKVRFAGTPMLRAKYRGFLRNVCVALGNVGDETVLPALRKAAEDSEPLIAEHARWAIEQILARGKLINPQD